MVGCDTRCDASCSCTSVIYSDILSTDGSALSVRKDSPICTCPHSTRRPQPDAPLKTTTCRPSPNTQLKLTTCRPKPASPLQTPPNRPPSDRPLHATTCLPQPLPATPRREETPREPDYLRLERTLISPGRIGPFEIPDPQPIYTARKFQLHKGETFNVAVDYLTRLRRYRKCAAEWAFPRDVANTPFFSVLFLHSAKQNPLAAPVEEPPSVAVVENQPAVISKPVVEENIPKSIATSDLSVCSSNKWGSVYKAMGSASEASSGSQQTDSAERLVRIWQDDFAGKSWGTGSTSELTTDAGVFDSGDVTLPITTPRTEEKSQTRREDFGQWYRALDQMDRLMGETAASVSNSSCSTAKTISLHRSTTLSSASCPLVTIPTVTEPHPPVDTVHHPRKKTIYCRIRKFFRGGPAHQQ